MEKNFDYIFLKQKKHNNEINYELTPQLKGIFDIIDKYQKLNVKPFIRITNLSDPFGVKDYEGGTLSAITAGIHINF